MEEEINYDEQGGITNAGKGRKIGREKKKRTKNGYGLVEKFMIKFSPRVNYLLDRKGKYKCRQEGLPKIIRIGPTNRCAARCFYCPREHIHAGGTGYMDWEMYREIIDWAKENNTATIALALFGEPLLHPRILDMVKLAQEKNLEIRLSTNAIVLTRELADKLLEFPINAIEISMDGFTDQEFLQGKLVDKYQDAKKNTLYLLARAKEKKHQAIFNIHFVDIGNVSLVNKIKFIRFWKKELAGLNFQRSFYYEPHNWAGTRDYLREQMGWLDRLLGACELKKPCVYVKGLNINWNGDALICANDPTPAAVLGNIRVSKLEEIYNNAKRMQYLEEQETGNFKNFNCGICTVNSVLPLSFIKRRLTNTLVGWLS